MFSNDEQLRRILVTMHEMSAKVTINSYFNTPIAIIRRHLDLDILLSLVVVYSFGEIVLKKCTQPVTSIPFSDLYPVCEVRKNSCMGG